MFLSFVLCLSSFAYVLQSWVNHETHDWFMIGFGIFMIGQTWIFPEGRTTKCDQLWGTVADGSCQAARSKEHRYAKKTERRFGFKFCFVGNLMGKW